MIGFLIMSFNLILLYFTLKNYYRFHKLSTILILIVLLSMAFKNLALLFNSTENTSIILKAGTSTMVLFSFSILIAIIQAGTLSIKYMYLSSVRRYTWILSFFLMFSWFFINQKEIVTNSNFLNFILNNIFEFIIVSFVMVVGIFSYKEKKQLYLLLSGISYFFLLIIFYLFGLNLVTSFSICQLVFITFLLLNEKKTIEETIIPRNIITRNYLD